jgi:hypothetical protein
MLSAGAESFLTTREMAIAVWATLALAVAMSKKGIRGSLARIIRTAVNWKFVVPAVTMAAYTAIVVTGLAKVGLWTSDLVKDTVLWYLFAGIALLFSGLTRDSEKRGFWRRLLLGQITATLLVEWLVNNYTFPFLVEFLLVPVAFLLGGIGAVAQSRPDAAVMKKFTSWTLGLLGFFALAFSIKEVIAHIRAGEATSVFRSIALTPLLSVAIVPLAYALGIVSACENLLIRVGFATKESSDPHLARYAVRKIAWRCRLNPRKIAQFAKVYTRALFDVRTRADVDTLIQLSRCSHRGIVRVNE